MTRWINSDLADYWISRPAEVESFLKEKVKKGVLAQIGLSAGGRPIWSVSYGLHRRKEGTTNFAAASGAKHTDSFYGLPSLNHPVQLVVCGTHGAEMEGVVGAINLIHIFETGVDLRGQTWPDLYALGTQMRVIIIPLHNPDGRERVEPASLVGMHFQQFRYWAQGQWSDGRLIGYPECKRHQPINPDDADFLGGYPNDDGFNIMHDVVMSGPLTSEARALFRLLEEERPDCVVHVHSCGSGPYIIGPSRFVTEKHKSQHIKIQQRMYEMWKGRQLRPTKPNTNSNRGIINLNEASFFACGSLSMIMEGPHGLADCPFSHTEIVSIHLSFYEELFRNVLNMPVCAQELNRP